MSDIPAAWASIADWLAVHAPTSHATLQPGATAAEVRATEERPGMNLPADLVALLTACNGTVDRSLLNSNPTEYHPGLILKGRHLLPLEEIGYGLWTTGNDQDFWNGWIPFAVSDYADLPWSGLAVDAEGRLATFLLASGQAPDGALPWPGYRSLGEFVDSVADALIRAAPAPSPRRPASTAEWCGDRGR